MNRADKRARRAAEHLAWLKWHAKACVICGASADGGGMYAYMDDGMEPNEVHVCDEHDWDDDALNEAVRVLRSAP